VGPYQGVLYFHFYAIRRDPWLVLAKSVLRMALPPVVADLLRVSALVAIAGAVRGAGDFESNESGSHHAEASARQMPPVLGQSESVSNPGRTLSLCDTIVLWCHRVHLSSTKVSHAARAMGGDPSLETQRRGGALSAMGGGWPFIPSLLETRWRPFSSCFLPGLVVALHVGSIGGLGLGLALRCAPFAFCAPAGRPRPAAGTYLEGDVIHLGRVWGGRW
jgi:hypothetical protein